MPLAAGLAHPYRESQQLVTQLVDGKVRALISSEPRDSTEKK